MSSFQTDFDDNPESMPALRCYVDEQSPEPEILPLRSPLSRTEQLEQLLLSLNNPLVPEPAVARRFQETNQRQFARCPITAETTSAILTLNGRSYDCQLVELSIGGFGVLIPGLPKLSVGSQGKLRAPGFNYIVTMTRQEIRSEGTYVGLRQLEEIVDRDFFHPSASLLNYVIAGVAGALTATLMYCFKFGS